MEFLVILIAWAAVQLWGSGGAIQQDNWLRQYYQAAQSLDKYIDRLLVVIGIPVLLLLFVVVLIEPLFMGLPLLLINIAGLLYSLGRGDMQIRLKLYLNSWMRGDLEGAYQHGMMFNNELGELGADNALELHQRVRKAMLYHGFERWFAVVFWFVVAGVPGALAYRLILILSEDQATRQQDRDRLHRVLYYLEWLPVRLLGFAFSLIGNFDNCYKVLLKHMRDANPSAELLQLYAVAALPMSLPEGQLDGEHFVTAAADELEAIQHLLTRSLLVWVAMVALWQIV
ncbi:MAG: regulatory signaling modulator protein AmpE [Spongiibacteraceae bacterium]